MDYIKDIINSNERFPKNREDILAFALSLAVHEMEAEELEKLKLYIIELCITCRIDYLSFSGILNILESNNCI